MTVPYLFATQGGPIPLSELDANFASLIDTSNVVYYGADPTGAVDSGPAFNEALATVDYVEATGTFLITTSITGTYSNKRMVGKSATLKTTAASNFNIIKFPDGADGNEVSGFTFQGVGVTDTATPVIGVYIYRSDNNNIHDNTFTGLNINVNVFDDGVTGAATNPKRNQIHNNLFLDAYGPANGGYGVLNVKGISTLIVDNIFSPGTFGRHCIYLSAGSKQCIVDSNYCIGSTLGVMALNTGTVAADSIQNCTITGNIFIGPGSSVASSHSFTGTGKIQNCVIANNQFDAAGDNGFLLQSASAGMIPSANIISGNRISSAQSYGMYLLDAFNNVISGNFFENNGAATGILYEIVVGPNLSASADGNLITDNYFGASLSSLRTCVNLGASTSNNVVSNNRLAAQSTLSQYQILDSGTGNFVEARNCGAQTLTYGATVTPDPTLGEFIQVTLTGNLTIANVTWPYQGQTVTFYLIQDGTGGRTVTWGAAYDANATWSDTGNTANKTSSISFKFIGTRWRQIGAQVVWHTAV